jgi:hypothetical protein
VREYKELNYQFKTNNIMRTKLSNLLKPALLIGAVSGCLFFQSCKDSIEIEQYKSLHSYCNQMYFTGTKVWVLDWAGKPLSLEMWVQEDIHGLKCDSILKIQMDSALIVKAKIEACFK